ncbi:hypothetical protein A176_006988 [Myxococcus hansupus]|uniref:Lipoprotein n=2 Tax=Pseudomyxococcus hansupus TaxID=1297742 RepID=A0A0H4X360_9BACT|nr:hypothetical protein A176_006988 [Myxococcus hansupus]
MRITCLVLLGALGGCTRAAPGDAVSTASWGHASGWVVGAVTDAAVGAPMGATVKAAGGMATLAATACSDLSRPVLALSATVLTGAQWSMAAEHTKGKRKSSWDKHTKTRSGGKEKKDSRMRFNQGADDNSKQKKEEAARKKEAEKQKKEEARQKKEAERIEREEAQRKKESAKK